MSKDNGQGAGSLFPPHVPREYSLLAGGERAALIGPRGDIAWMCAAVAAISTERTPKWTR